MSATFTSGAGRPTLRTEVIEHELRNRPPEIRPVRPTEDQRFRADLERAPAAALDAARKQRQRLDDLATKAKLADQAVIEARERVVSGVVGGTVDGGAQRAVEAAKAKSRAAADVLDEQRQIVAEIEERLVAGVRAGDAAEAEAHAQAARVLYDAGYGQLREVLTASLGAMRQARTAELRASKAVAVARRQPILDGSIPEEVERLIIDLGDNGGRRQNLSVDEILVRLVRRR